MTLARNSWTLLTSTTSMCIANSIIACHVSVLTILMYRREYNTWAANRKVPKKVKIVIDLTKTAEEKGAIHME